MKCVIRRIILLEGRRGFYYINKSLSDSEKIWGWWVRDWEKETDLNSENECLGES